MTPDEDETIYTQINFPL